MFISGTIINTQLIYTPHRQKGIVSHLDELIDEQIYVAFSRGRKWGCHPEKVGHDAARQS